MVGAVQVTVRVWLGESDEAMVVGADGGTIGVVGEELGPTKVWTSLKQSVPPPVKPVTTPEALHDVTFTEFTVTVAPAGAALKSRVFDEP